MTPELKQITDTLKPAIEASLDGVCVVDHELRIVFATALMRNILQVSPREIKTQPIFCQCITLGVCKRRCQLEKSLETGESERFDETPATLGAGAEFRKVRLILRLVPLGSSKKPMGLLISARDTSSEFILQAKYHKLKEMYLLKQRS